MEIGYDPSIHVDLSAYAWNAVKASREIIDTILVRSCARAPHVQSCLLWVPCVHCVESGDEVCQIFQS